MKYTLFALTLLHMALQGFAAEAELMVSPRIANPEAKTLYSEEMTNFFGTNVYLLQGSELTKRAGAKAGTPKQVLTTDVKQIPATSIIKVYVTGGTEEQNQKYLDLLIQEFFAFRKELRDETHIKKIEQLEKAVLQTKDKELQDKLKKSLESVKLSYLAGDTEMFKRIK